MHPTRVVFALLFLATAGCNCRVAGLRAVPDSGCIPEVCNGLDDDCDGEVDNGFSGETCGVGACARVVSTCVDGQPASCVPGQPQVEICNGADDDCNGLVDDGVCQAPTVVCPASQQVQAGQPVTLVGQASDADGTVVSTSWTVSRAPGGSSAGPDTPTFSTTTFTPDLGGDFELTFCAKDNDDHESCCTTALSTAACASPPAPPVSTACATSWDGRPIVQFAPVPVGLVYQLTQSGSAMVLAQAADGENWMRPAARIDVGGAPPGTTVGLEVRACRAADPSCCSTPTPLSVDVVAECTTLVSPTAANVVLSEYVPNGEGTCPSPDCATQDTCQAGEAVEITNLSNCPVSLDGFHFSYRNANASTASYRWMNFGPTDIVPPRGVYVAIRNRQYAPNCAAPLPAESPGLYGLKVSPLQMQGLNLCNGWFNNTGGGLSELQVAPGTVIDGASLTFTPSAAIARVAPYLPTSGSLPACNSVGFDAVDSCGTVIGGSAPTQVLAPNQLGRLWHPCDAVVNPVPACVRN